MVDSHVMILFDYKKVWFERTWFDLDLIWIDHDLIYDLNESQVSVMWVGQSRTLCLWPLDNTRNNMTIRKANSITETHIEQKLSALCIFFRLFFCKIWLPCVFASRTSEFKIRLQLWFDLIWDLGWNDLWFRGVIWDLICDLA